MVDRVDVIDESTNIEHCKSNRVYGSLLGLMVGDTLGLPYEGLQYSRIQKLLARKTLKQSLLGNRGMVSDDTEHAVITAMALMDSLSNSKHFSKSLAWRLRWWFFRLPAGIGMATGKALIKLWFGYSPNNSGVYSAGNGPAMRAPVIGVCYGSDHQQLKEYIKRSTVLTHKDPKAYFGALAVALAAYYAAHKPQIDFNTYSQVLLQLLEEENADEFDNFTTLLNKVQNALSANQTPKEFASSLGLEKGVSGYIYHTVPIVLYIWFQNQNNYEQAIESIIRLGGDTDTTAAILGGIIGAAVGEQGIPQSWVKDILDWPFSVSYIRIVAEEVTEALASNTPKKRILRLGPLVVVRNLFFLTIVLLHGFRRLLPPY